MEVKCVFCELDTVFLKYHLDELQALKRVDNMPIICLCYGLRGIGILLLRVE